MIEITWDNDIETILILNYYNPVASWDEYHAAINKAFAMIKERPHTVHMIHNTGNVRMPSGNAMSELRRVVESSPSNLGYTCMVITNLLASLITETMVKVSFRKSNFHFVKSVDDAKSLIKRLGNPS